MANADIQAQRDALAKVVAKVWNNARDACELYAVEVEAWMTESGLAEYVAATEDVPDLDIEVGDQVIRLSDLGKAALAGGEP
jgi:hypothetical protein